MSNALIQIIQKLLSLLEKLPYILVSFGIGKKMVEAEKREIEKDLILTKIELEKKSNELKVIEQNSGKSDDDIIRHAIESRRLFELRGKKTSESGDN
jgi:hypothetical protein